MSIIFNLIKYAQEGEQRRLVTNPTSTSDPRTRSGPDAPYSPMQDSGVGGSSSTSPPAGNGIEYSYALQRAKQIIVEHGKDTEGAHIQLQSEIFNKINETDKKKLLSELDFFATRQMIPFLHKEESNSDLSDIAKQISIQIDNSGFDGARDWVEYNVSDDLKNSALNIIDAHEKGSFDISNLSEQKSDVVQISLDNLNKAAVKALKYLVENQEVNAAMDKCGNTILANPRRRDRVKRAIIDLASRGKSIFSREDLLGSMAYRQRDFLAFYVGLHSHQLSKGSSPLITGPAHDSINRIFSTRKQTRPLGQVHQKDESKHVVKVHDLFKNIDGGMNTHKLSDGKYMFEHLAQEIANGLNSEPPEPNALCIVLLKLEFMAESSSSREIAMSQIGGSRGGKGDGDREGGLEGLIESGNSRPMVDDVKKEPTITSYSPGQSTQALEMVKNKSETIKNTIKKIVAFAEGTGQQDVSDYFQSAEMRINTALQSTENWLSGNILTEKANNGYSPSWHYMIEIIRKYQIVQEVKNKKNPDILERGDFTKLPSAPMERDIDGINLKIYFSFIKSAASKPSTQSTYVTDKEGKSVRLNIPVFDVNIEKIEIKDRMEAKPDMPSEADEKLLKTLIPYFSSKTLIQGTVLSVDEKINSILKIFRDNISIFERAAKILKQSASGDTKTRIPNLLGISKEQIPNFNISALTVKGGILNKSSAPSYQELLEARSILPANNYLNLLIGISEKMGKIGKGDRPMTPALNSSIRKLLARMADVGQLSQEEYEEISKFRALPQTATGGARTANEVEAWIKVMAKMML